MKFTPLTLGLFLVGAICAPVFAQDANSNKSLQQQISSLQREVASLKKEVSKTDFDIEQQKKSSGSKITSQEGDVKQLNSIKYLPIDFDVPGQSFVSSGPYLGIQLQYSGSNLIINSPSINEDALLLKMRNNINQRLNNLGMPRGENKSHLLLSGFVEGQLGYIGSGINKPSTTNVDLSAANLDAYILGPNSWTSGLMEFAYGNSLGTTEGSFANNSRPQNSRVYMNKAFIILGDFAYSPFYTSIGQMFIPFGVYNSTMISTPVTKMLGFTKARAINFGYQQQSSNALFGAVYLFKGDSYVKNSGRINNGGINFGYRMNTGPFSEVFGAGVIGNIADAVASQNTGMQSSSMFGGFGSTGSCTGLNGSTGNCGNEKLVHRVPAYNFNGKFSIGHEVDILAEYITASTSYSPLDMAINSRGARPQAFNAEAIYSFDAFTHPTSVALSYQLTKDGLAIGMPAKRYSFAMNTSIWRNTLESLELRHDVNYSKNVTSSGSQIASFSGSGRSGNVITAQIDLFF